MVFTDARTNRSIDIPFDAYRQLVAEVEAEVTADPETKLAVDRLINTRFNRALEARVTAMIDAKQEAA